MLQNLQINHFVTIKALEIEFHPGLTVITGETGAGKSILIKAIEQILGGRTTPESIAPKAAQAEIIASFNVGSDSGAYHWLSEHELDDENTCIIRRVVKRDGRSKSYINGRAVPLSLIKALGILLVNIHGQHDNQNLLSGYYQRDLIDAFISDQTLISTVKTHYKAWQKACKQLEALKQMAQQKSDRYELLSYQVQELEALNLAENEIGEIERTHKRMAHQEDILHAAHEIISALDADDSIWQQLAFLEKILLKLAHLDDGFQASVKLLGEAQILLEECQEHIKSQIDTKEFDEQAFKHIETRLEEITNLARKHRVKPEALFELSQTLSSELTDLQSAEENLEAQERAVKEYRSLFDSAAKKLSLERQKAAKQLEKQVIPLLHQLKMPRAEFQVSFTQCEDDALSTHGFDKVQFLLKTNPEQALRPLAKVASGGELSRVSLAIEAIIGKELVTPTFIFDEVDVGIGGSTAQTVGALLKKLGQSRQVFSITHLPQVAAQGEYHLKVEKHMTKSSTETTITNLDKTARIGEVARMLGGQEITEHVRAHAKEIIEATEN